MLPEDRAIKDTQKNRAGNAGRGTANTVAPEGREDQTGNKNPDCEQPGFRDGGDGQNRTADLRVMNPPL